jgi:alpha-tubulin suppressor-like RCC1 family protein
VSGRNDSCFAMTEDGSVFSWGWENEWGQLGNGTKEENELPKKVGGVLEGKVVVQLAASNCHVLALTKEGEIYTWGRNDNKQLGLELEDSIESVSVPTRIRSSQYDYEKIVAVACCRSGSAAISGNGEVIKYLSFVK